MKIIGIHEEIEKLQSQYSAICRQLQILPKGDLRIRNRGKYYYLYGKKPGDKKEHYIPIDSEDAVGLLNTDYCEKLKAAIEQELQCLERFHDAYHSESKYAVYEELPEPLAGRIERIIVPPEERARLWEQQPFESNPYGFDDSTVLITDKGERVRSKSEYIIARELARMGLPYRYECVYRHGAFRAYPDFTVMDPHTGELFYIEYFGMMDDPLYARRAMEKIAQYQLTPDASHFIYLFESAREPLNIRAVRNLLTQVFGTGGSKGK